MHRGRAAQADARSAAASGLGAHFVAELDQRLARVLEDGTRGLGPGLSQWPDESVIGVTVSHMAL